MIIIIILFLICIALVFYCLRFLETYSTANFVKENDNSSVTTYKDGTVVVDYQIAITNNSSTLTTASDIATNEIFFTTPFTLLSSTDIVILPLLQGSSQYSVKDFWVIQDSDLTTGFGFIVHQEEIAAGANVKVLLKARFTGRV